MWLNVLAWKNRKNSGRYQEGNRRASLVGHQACFFSQRLTKWSFVQAYERLPSGWPLALSSSGVSVPESMEVNLTLGVAGCAHYSHTSVSKTLYVFPGSSGKRHTHSDSEHLGGAEPCVSNQPQLVVLSVPRLTLSRIGHQPHQPSLCTAQRICSLNSLRSSIQWQF